MDWGLILRESVLVGLVVGAIVTVLIIITLLINKEMWLQDYPPDVKARWGPMSEKAKRQRTILVFPFFGTLIAGMVYTVAQLQAQTGAPPSFLTVFAAATIEFLVFNLIDAVIIDWLILMVLWPGLGVLPGTEGMAGYKDMRLWTVNLFKGVVISGVIGLLTAGVASLVYWVQTL